MKEDDQNTEVKDKKDETNDENAHKDGGNEGDTENPNETESEDSSPQENKDKPLTADEKDEIEEENSGCIKMAASLLNSDPHDFGKHAVMLCSINNLYKLFQVTVF